MARLLHPGLAPPVMRGGTHLEPPMHAEFWHDLWNRNAVSFHRRDVHPYVRTYLPPEVLQGKRVLVPLCGKSVDMMYLREHAEHVVGVELVRKGIEAFFAENDLPYTQPTPDRYEAEGITLICGDFFALTEADTGLIDIVHDRASLVALPHAMRLTYAATLKRLCRPGSWQLVNTLEYGPFDLGEAPFSLSAADVASYYADAFDIEHVEAPLLPNHPIVKKFNLQFLYEHAFILRRR